jgi:hypothetical protein
MRKAKATLGMVEGLVLRLAGGAELTAVLAESGMTIRQARILMRGRIARRVLKELKEMQDFQKGLMLDHLTPQAGEALARQMGPEAKPELQMRGALLVLGLGRPAARKKAEEAVAEEAATKVPEMSEEEILAIVKEEAEAMAARDRERYAG